MEDCENCKHKIFYERYKELDEYIEKEADKRLAKMIEEGKVGVLKK